MSEQSPIATIQKNSRERVYIDLTEFKGHNLVDIRVFADNGSEHTATKKGVSLAIAKLPILIEALRNAEAEARSLGQITDRKDRKAAA